MWFKIYLRLKNSQSNNDTTKKCIIALMYYLKYRLTTVPAQSSCTGTKSAKKKKKNIYSFNKPFINSFKI